MKEGDLCKITQSPCNPRDCRVEFCRWRDTIWVIQALKGWANNTSDNKPKPQSTSATSSNSSNASK